MTSTEHNSVIPWRFHNPVELFVGSGSRGMILEKWQRRMLIVSTKRGRSQFSGDEVLSKLSSETILWVDSVIENPSLQYLQQQVNELGSAHYDAVVAFGGGSAIDAAKVINLMLSNEFRQYSIGEVLKSPLLSSQARLKPLYAIPTTSGTGSEVTPFATIWDLVEKKKFSLSGDLLFPTTAFIDSDLTFSMPKMTRISTGLDVLSHALESIWNINANLITIDHASHALKLCLQALPNLVNDDCMTETRRQMSEASLFAGLAISHTRTALSHSISYPITSHFGVPHGFACAFTLTAVLRLNLKTEDSRFSRLSEELWGDPDPLNLLRFVKKTCQLLGVSSVIKKYIPNVEALLGLEAEMYAPGRFENNLVPVSRLTEILLESWQEI